jgi:hypothetical protein
MLVNDPKTCNTFGVSPSESQRKEIRDVGAGCTAGNSLAVGRRSLTARTLPGRFWTLIDPPFANTPVGIKKGRHATQFWGLPGGPFFLA